MEAVYDNVMIASLIIAVVSCILTVVDSFFTRHRIVREVRDGKTKYIPQESIVLVFWKDMKHWISPYASYRYEFDTFVEAEDFIDSLKKRDKMTRTVVK